MLEDRAVRKLIDRIFPSRREAVAEADELMEAYGNEAYWVARRLMREARERGDRRAERIYSRAKREIAKRTDFPIGPDTATALLNGDVRSLVRPRDATLH